jgi:hypothetical protein
LYSLRGPPSLAHGIFYGFVGERRLVDPKGDRVKITLSGFLPFRYYCATGNALAYGLKEE